MIRSPSDPYQTQLTDPALLEAIGDVMDLHVLDAGCGEGYLARKLDALGAEALARISAQPPIPLGDASRENHLISTTGPISYVFSGQLVQGNFVS
jgi:2-polyprenyl-3-methyl-5-hydroxy-6-metoxy-1,4-benzoquinol methylase